MFRHIDIIQKCLRDIKKPIVLEIGVCEGRNTRLLLPFISKKKGLLVSVDPGDPIYGLYDKCDLRYSKSWQLIRNQSLKAIPFLAYKFNCILIDGDHNYFTVYNELNLPKNKVVEGGLIFIHDVASRTCAFNDFYYNVNSIPFKFRHIKGIIYPNTVDAPRNKTIKKQGVFNAVIDFVKINPCFIPIYFT